jgi:hypothetical protein
MLLKPSNTAVPGSGTGVAGGTENVPESEIAPVCAGVWVKLSVTLAGKVPLAPPKLPAVQFPSMKKDAVAPLTPTEVVSVMEVLVNVPKTESPNEKLVPTVLSNEVLPKS